MVYIREAHALDSPAPKSFLEIEDPIELAERQEVCSACIEDLEIPIPAIVDKLDDQVNRDYGAQPDRLYLVGKDGKIAYAGAKGPGGFKPDELEQAIVKELGGAPATVPPDHPAANGPRPRGGGPGFGGMRGRPGGGPTRPDPRMMFRRVDANGDGKLTKEELPPNMLPRWDRMDANGDGVVDQQEQAAIIERIRRAGVRPGG